MDEEEIQRRIRAVLKKGIERAAADEGMSVEDFQRMLQPAVKDADRKLGEILSQSISDSSSIATAISDTDKFMAQFQGKNGPKPPGF